MAAMASLNSYPTPKPFDSSQDGGQVQEAATRLMEMEMEATEDEPPNWLPFWLRQTTLGIFICAFVCLIAAQVVILIYSHRHQGLVSVQSDLEYLWQFGPTGILTILAILWSRVELQALRYMPYFQVYHAVDDSSAQDSFDLDYTRMLPPVVLLESLRRRHLPVFFATIASIFLKATVILSSGLFISASVQVSLPVEVDMPDFFVSDGARHSFDADDSAHSVATAIKDYGMELPFGVTSMGAYQTFSMRLPWEQDNVKSSRGTINAQLEVSVDYVTVDTECLLLQSYDVSNPNDLPYDNDILEGWWYDDIQVRLQFEACDEEIIVPMDTVSQATGPFPENRATQWLMARVGQGTESADVADMYSGVIQGINITHACPSLSQQGPMILYMLGSWGPSSSDESKPNLETSSAALCSVRAGVSKAKVLDDGIRPVVTVLPDQEETLDLGPNIWGVLLRHPSTAFFHTVTADAELSGPLLRLVEFGEGLDLEDLTLLTSEDLAEAVYNLTDRVGAMIGHLKLRQTFDDPEVRTAVIHAQFQRLQVNQAVGISMGVLFSLCLSIAVWMMLGSNMDLGAWYRDPATIPGLMCLLGKPSEILTRVERVSSEMRAENKAKWQHGEFSPIILRTWARVLFTIYVVALIIALAMTLRTSETSQGLATVNEEGHSPFWKIIPALALFLVTLYNNSADTAIRALSELFTLSSKVDFCTMQDIDRSLLDMIGLRAWYYSIRLRARPVTAAQTLAILSSVLVTLASSLFDARLVPQSSKVSLPQNSWFGTRDNPSEAGSAFDIFWDQYHETRSIVSGLLVMRDWSNSTSPPGTFDDLLLPSLDLGVARTSKDLRGASSAQIQMPAARLDAHCSQFKEGRDFRLRFEDDATYLIQSGFDCNEQPTILHEVSEEEHVMNTYIANEVDYTDENECENRDYDTILYTVWNKPWVARTYAWGEISLEGDEPEILHLSVWRCNYTWVEVTADLTFFWSDGELVLDHERSSQNNPAISEDDQSGPWEPPFNPPLTSGVFDDLSENNMPWISGSFAFLVGSQGPFEHQDLGNASREDDILQALHSNMAFATAQLANIESRLNISETSSLPPERSPDELPPLEAAFIHERQRLFQDPNVTYALITILSLIAFVNLWALSSAALRRYFLSRTENTAAWWLLDLEFKGQAPDGFSSISMMEALLHGSNYSSYMPENAALKSPKELHRCFAGKRFRMGWFWKESKGSSIFTIGVITPSDQEAASDDVYGDRFEESGVSFLGAGVAR